MSLNCFIISAFCLQQPAGPHVPSGKTAPSQGEQKNLKVSLRAIFLSTSLHSLPFVLLSINHISVVAFCISFVVLNACVFHVICFCLFDSYPHQVLDLSSNNLVTIEGLKDINLLTWLSLANNNIKAMENLHQVREPSNCKTIQQTNDYGN